MRTLVLFAIGALVIGFGVPAASAAVAPNTWTDSVLVPHYYVCDQNGNCWITPCVSSGEKC